jgi:tRNA dimethylallyltransferase
VNSQKKIIAIVGQTASGKSRLALDLAREFDGELIAADSRTIYKGMNIGTAKSQQDEIAEWGIDLVSPDEKFNAFDFKEYAEQKIQDIINRGKLPIVVGGTGLYIQALIDNFNFEGEQGESEYDALQIAVVWPREELYEQIDSRVDKMIEKGLVEEVRGLRERYGCDIKSMTGIGYRQVCEYLDKKIDKEEMIRLIKRDTRHYAKRQMTWFKRDDRIHWVESKERARKLVLDHLNT